MQEHTCNFALIRVLNRLFQLFFYTLLVPFRKYRYVEPSPIPYTNGNDYNRKYEVHCLDIVVQDRWAKH